MPSKTYTVLTLLVTSSAAFAWQPLTYPIRSQSPYERGVDNAMCYAEASRVSNVDIRREPQVPPRPKPVAKGSSTGAPSKPPLPPSSFSATPLPYAAASMPDGASMPNGASMPIAGAPSGASSANAADAAIAAAAAAGARASATAAAGASTAKTTAAAGASEAVGASAASDAALQANAASDVKLPPLPAPEPPMTRYWAAYAACMQARGYVVAQ
ncbi:hypothetical protein [Paraburkholderia sp. HD33-4]|uniref:hypothetical protein n=1 Tax=Paraburkholderia sp. HD33-4 TaxID=2883242 RepID=UPI001F479889|nr:hypothetical protein [Paraburkholderia sp. HD33-4]